MKFFHYLLVLPVFLLGGCATVSRQAEIIALFTTPPRVELREQEVSIALVVGQGGRRYVPVEIHGRRLLFLLDTGSPTAVVADTVARDDNITTISAPRGFLRGAGGAASASAGIIEELRVGPVIISRLPVLFTDLSVAFGNEQVSATEHKTIVGVMGSNLLEFLRASIDYTTNTLTIRKPNQSTTDNSGALPPRV